MAIKKLQNNFTTLEQSKLLLEIGVPRWTADEYRDEKGYRHTLEGILDVELFFQNFPDYLPCWSVGRLMEIYDTCVENTESWPTVKQHISYIINTIVAIDHAVKCEEMDFSKLEE